jgi:predicted nucleic acid-binding Zn ribbon protein
VPWKPLPGSGGDEPVELQANLDRLLDHLTGSSTTTNLSLFERWAELVGDSVAAHTRPAKLSEGVLTVAVDDPAWATQLRFLEQDLLARISEAAGSTTIVSIAWHVTGSDARRR